LGIIELLILSRLAGRYQRNWNIDLEYRPGRLFVNVYKRPKYVSPISDVIIAPMPDHPIERCKAIAPEKMGWSYGYIETQTIEIQEALSVLKRKGI